MGQEITTKAMMILGASSTDSLRNKGFFVRGELLSQDKIPAAFWPERPTEVFVPGLGIPLNGFAFY